MSLRDRTPAEVARIKFPYKNWKEVVEQPYEITSKIPIRNKPIIQRFKIAVGKKRKTKKTIRSHKIYSNSINVMRG